MEQHGFYTGTECTAYQWLGAHVIENGVTFRVFAPAAAGVSVIGEFSHWQERAMHPLLGGSFYELTLGDARPGMAYLLRIHKKDGSYADHLDPYAFETRREELTAEEETEETVPDTEAAAEAIAAGEAVEAPRFRFLSVVCDLRQFAFSDKKWMDRRTDGKKEPMNIYELHLGSWREDMNYRTIAKPLLDYLEEMGYNCLELMPVTEYPAEESWGYQAVGYYSPTQRYGTPEDLMHLINECHRRGVRVILDLALVHFAVDAYGLGDFDGTPLYEYPRADLRLSEWGSKNFNYSRGAIRSFLLSSVLFWLREYHFDGVRLDAVRNMLYPHGNTELGEHLDGAKFLRTLTQTIKAAEPTACLIAEDSSAYPGVTASVEKGGLGFDYKWDMGWMNDTLAYFQMSPEQRKERYYSLSFSMFYYYSERFLMPFSHDEVVHGKATILQKMNGDYQGKFPQCRALYLYMYTHPGKKLNFMGNELGQLREWDEKREQDWNLLEYPVHQQYQRFTRELNRMYLVSPALFRRDYAYSGFRWLDCEPGNLVYAYLRESTEQLMLCVFNFDSVSVPEYHLALPEIDAVRLVLDTNWDKYGGELEHKPEWLEMDEEGITLTLEPFSGKLFTLLRGEDYVIPADEGEVVREVVRSGNEMVVTTENPALKAAEEEISHLTEEELEALLEAEQLPDLTEEELETILEEQELPQLNEEERETITHAEWFQKISEEELVKLVKQSAHGRNSYGGEATEEELERITKAEWFLNLSEEERESVLRTRQSLALSEEKGKALEREKRLLGLSREKREAYERAREILARREEKRELYAHAKWFLKLSKEGRRQLVSGSAHGRNNYGPQPSEEKTEGKEEETHAE